nr:hypothetical protein [Prevotella sp.]
YYLNARYYDAKIARFLTEDTYKGRQNDPLSLNLYTYCHNEPVMYRDPSGHKEDNDRYIDINTEAGAKAMAILNAATEEWGRLNSEMSKYTKGSKKYNEIKGQRDLQHEIAENARAEYALYSRDVNYMSCKYGLLSQEQSSNPIKPTNDLSVNIYVYDPYNWNNEFQNNIIPLIDSIPVIMKEDKRAELINNIIITEVEKLQRKYRTVYNASNNVIYDFRTFLFGEENVHDVLEPLYEEFGFNINKADGYSEYFESFLLGLKLGTWEAASSPVGNSSALKNGLNISDDTLNWLNKGDANTSVYYGVKNGEEVYTGITKQELAKRLYQHNYNGKDFETLVEQVSGLTKNQARAIEQYLIENGPANALNKANSISPNSKYYKEALQWAEDYIKNLK